MRHWVLLLLLAVTVAVIAYLVVWVFTGNDDGLDPQEPDGRAVPLPSSRPLVESDISAVHFDTVARGYRMVQVDAALRRAAYDIGYKQELIDVLEAEVIALRDGRADDAEALRQARDGTVGATGTSVVMTSLARPSPAASVESVAGPVDGDADDDVRDQATEAEPDIEAEPDAGAEQATAAAAAADADKPGGDAAGGPDQGDRRGGQASGSAHRAIRAVTR